MHKITQSHFDVEIETPAGGSAISNVVDEIGTRIHEYANQEDVTADFEIVFEIGSSFSVARTSPDILKVELEGSESADDVLDAIADDLYMMYDEMDSDYTDDAYDLRIDMDITPGRRRPTPPSTPPTPPSGDGGAPDESVIEAEEDLEEAIEDRLRGALSGQTKLDSRATVARMDRIIRRAGIEGVKIAVEFGNEYSVDRGAPDEVRVTLVNKKKDVATVNQVISDIADVMVSATVKEVDAEVDQVVSEAALDEAEDSEELAEKVEGIVEKLEIDDLGGTVDISEEDLERDLKVKILGQLAREMLLGTIEMKERQSESEGDESSDLYTSILNTLRDNPKYREAFELPDRFLNKYTPNLQAYALVSMVNDARIKRLHDMLIETLIDEERSAAAEELQLLCWSLAVYNLGVDEARKSKLDLPDKDSFFDLKSMRAYTSLKQGKVGGVALPGVKTLSLKPLVDVKGDVPDITARAKNVNSDVQRTYVNDFFQAVGNTIATTVRECAATVTDSRDLQIAIEVARVWGDLSVGEKALALVASVNRGHLKRLHAALVKACKASGAAANDRDQEVLAIFAYLFNKSFDQDVYMTERPRRGALFNADYMECVGQPGGRVGETLVPMYYSDRGGISTLKALVTCTMSRKRDVPPPLPSSVRDYSKVLGAVREDDALMRALMIPEDRRGDVDLMLNLLVKLDNPTYIDRARRVISENDLADLTAMAKEAPFIDAVAGSLGNFAQAMSTVYGNSEYYEALQIPSSGLSLEERKRELIVRLANEARVRRIADFFTDRIFDSRYRPSVVARDADPILDLAVELHNRTSRSADAWVRRDTSVGEFTGDGAVTSDLNQGEIAEVYLRGIAESTDRIPSVVRIEESVEDVTEPGESADLYAGILDTLRDNPTYRKALGIPSRLFEDTAFSSQALVIGSSMGPNSIKRLHDALAKRIRSESRSATDEELILLCWALAVCNLGLLDSKRGVLEIPAANSRYVPNTMRTFGNVVSGGVSAVALPGVKAFKLKPLVAVDRADIQDVTERAKEAYGYVQRVYVRDFQSAIGDDFAALIRSGAATITGSTTLQRAIEVSKVWGDLTEDERDLALVGSVSTSHLERLHAALVKADKSASAEELDVLALFNDLNNARSDRDVYTMYTPSAGDEFDAKVMVCAGQEGSYVAEVLVPALISTKKPLKALVTCGSVPKTAGI